jgi:hypothetical protein
MGFFSKRCALVIKSFTHSGCVKFNGAFVVNTVAKSMANACAEFGRHINVRLCVPDPKELA